ncbi:MAG: TVP38/TMEM64 family protein [Thermodesulfovibrionia bacterium]|nr:TVP38/TMEM64 family protein [Thermodesulfovibrionia bacterium]
MSTRTVPAEKGGRKIKTVKIILSIIVIAALVVTAKYFDLQQVFRDTLAWISGLGSVAPLIFTAIYILACVLLLPGAILTLGAGVVFGVVKGSIVVSIGSTLGATCAFLVGRYLARGWVSGKISGNEKFKAVDEAVAREGWKIVLLTRLSPVFPFNLLNYAFGLTKVSLKQYFLASWIGMIPGTIMYVYIGSLAGDLASLGTGGRTRTTGEWILYGIGLLATVAVTIFVTRIAKKAVASRIPLEENKR